MERQGGEVDGFCTIEFGFEKMKEMKVENHFGLISILVNTIL